MIAFLFDQHVPVAVSNGLRLRGVEVLTAYEDGNAVLDDELLLVRATDLGRVLVTQDEDFLGIAGAWQAADREFAGIVCTSTAHRNREVHRRLGTYRKGVRTGAGAESRRASAAVAVSAFSPNAEGFALAHCGEVRMRERTCSFCQTRMSAKNG